MGPEKRAARFILTTAVAALLAIPVVNIGNTRFVVEAIIRNRADCGDGVGANNRNYPFDAIVIPGGGTVRTTNNDIVPSFEQEVRLGAAAVAYSKGLAPRIVLLDGESGFKGGSTETGEGFLQAAFVKVGYSGKIPAKGDILVDGKSTNTATNMQALARISTEHKIGKVAMITNRFHLLRATLSACINGVATSPIAAEDLTGIDENQAIRPSLLTKIKERLEVALLIWDPNGIVPTALKKMIS